MDQLAKTRKQGESELAEVRMRHMAELKGVLAARWASSPEETAYDTPPEEPKHVM